MSNLLQEDGTPLLQEDGEAFLVEQTGEVFRPERIVRNRSNIAFAQLRNLIDTQFEAKHDELSDCYYNFWKHGLSKPFDSGVRTYDVQPHPARSKALFDKLHAGIFYLREIAFHVENLNQPVQSRIDPARYNEIRDDADNLIETISDSAQQRLAELAAEGVELSI